MQSTFLATRTLPGDAARPWATTALLAAHAAQEQKAEAWAAAGVLTSEYAGTEHALPGLGMTVRLAAEDGDLASAEAALEGLQAGWPDLLETESAGGLVRLLAEADSLAGGRRGGLEGAAPAAAMQAAGAGFRLLGARPNPFTGRTSVPFEVGAASRVRVSVYDVLGREVAVLADGPRAPGRYEATFDGRGLAAGVYVVRATVAPAVGARRSYTTRITLLR